MIKNLLTNWKTTSAGVGLIITGLVHIGFGIAHMSMSEGDLAATITTILGGLGLVAAGDSSVSATKTDVQAVAQAVRTGDTTSIDKADTTKELPSDIH